MGLSGIILAREPLITLTRVANIDLCPLRNPPQLKFLVDAQSSRCVSLFRRCIRGDKRTVFRRAETRRQAHGFQWVHSECDAGTPYV